MPHLVTLAVSLILLGSAWRRPQLARALFALLFAAACLVNYRTALVTPLAYLDFAHTALLEPYRALILGPFAQHVALYVELIASCQGMIALGLVLGGEPGKLALVGATIFLIAIAPLGLSAAFPASLVMAAAAVLLLRSPDALREARWCATLSHPTARADERVSAQA